MDLQSHRGAIISPPREPGTLEQCILAPVAHSAPSELGNTILFRSDTLAGTRSARVAEFPESEEGWGTGTHRSGKHEKISKIKNLTFSFFPNIWFR